MSTAISTFRVPLRVLLGDRDSSFPIYEDAHLDNAVSAVLSMGRVEGLTASGGAIEPGVDNPNQYALILLHTARLFAMGAPSSEYVRTRALSHGSGSYATFLSALEADLHALENGVLFEGWQNFRQWVTGLVGTDLGEQLTNVVVAEDRHTLNAGINGVTVS